MMSSENPRRRVALRIGVGVVLAIVVGVVALAVVDAQHSSPPSGSSSGVAAGFGTGRQAPQFSIPRLGGGSAVSLAEFKDRPVVLNFFASWCTYCQTELHAFAVASHALGSDVAFVAVDSNDSKPGTALGLMRAAGATYPAGADPDGVVATSYLVGDLPTTVFIYPGGKVAGVGVGAQTVGDLEGWARILEGHGHPHN